MTDFNFDDLIDKFTSVKEAANLIGQAMSEAMEAPFEVLAEQLADLIGDDPSPGERDLPERELPKKVWSIPRRVGKNTQQRLYHRRLERDRNGSPISRKGKK